MIIVLFTIALLNRTDDPLSKATLCFIDFTNTGERTEALFWFTNTTDPEFAFHILNIRRLTPDGPFLEVPPTKYASVYNAARTSSEPTSNPDLVGIPVSVTNVPLEVSLRCFWPDEPSHKVMTFIYKKRDQLLNCPPRDYSQHMTTTITGGTIVALSPPNRDRLR